MAWQCRRQEERLRLRPRGRKGRPPCRTDSHGLGLLGKWRKRRERRRTEMAERTERGAMANAARCNGQRSALRRKMQRAAFFLSTFTGNPEQSALISPPAYSSTQINQPSQRHRLSSAHLPAHVSSLTSTSYVLLKPRLLPQQAHSFSTASALAPTQPERLPPHCQSVCLPPPTQSSSTTRTFGFLCQNACFPLPGRSASSACTFGFLCQHACLPLPARSASLARTLVRLTRQT